MFERGQMFDTAVMRSNHELRRTGSSHPTMPRSTRATRVGALLAALAFVVLLAACDVDVSLNDGEEGSGVAQTTQIDLPLDEVTEVRVRSAWTVRITVDPDQPAGGTIEMDDNLADLADLSLNGDRLTLDFDDNFDAVVTPTAVLTLPSLTALDLDGASDVFVDGEAIELIDLEVEGASGLRLAAVATRRIALDVNGASDVTLSGEVDVLEVSVGGAATVDLSGLVASSASVDAGGASTVLVSAASVRGSAGGASTISVGPGTDLDVSTGGASSIETRDE